MSYRINTPHIAHETIDSETIIIDFETGAYYSLQNVAHFIWQQIEAGYDLENIVIQVDARYRGERPHIEEAVNTFLQQLAQNRLIVPAPQISGNRISAHQAAGPATQEPFTPPVLEQYTDMQDLLLLDPIHEVDEQGWPMPKQQETK